MAGAVAEPGENGGWVVSSVRIPAAEQVAFLRRIVRRERPVGSQASDMAARITRQPVAVGGGTVQGKRGTGEPGSDNRYEAGRA